ncbi:unnamed protein product [Closterium sp. Naga37s-1]|nr:unnamed protein product [Closterium sp. Naga37s-1]
MGQTEPASTCGELQGREEGPSGSATAPGPQACLRRSPRLQILRGSAASSPGQPRQAVPQQQRHPLRAQPARAPAAPRAGPPRPGNSLAGGHERSQEGSRGVTRNEAAHQQQLGVNTEPPPCLHLRPRTPLSQQAEHAAAGDGNQEQAPRRREQEPAGREPVVGVQRPAADSRGAQPGEEPHGLAKRASNCPDSAPPVPGALPLTPPAEDPPSSQAGGTPHHHRARGDHASPPDHRDERASETAGGITVENHAGDVTTCAPGEARGNGGETGVGPVTGGVTADPPGPAASQQGRTDLPQRLQPTGPGRQWWRTCHRGHRGGRCRRLGDGSRRYNGYSRLESREISDDPSRDSRRRGNR